MIRKDGIINFTWSDSPASGVNSDGFSISWMGQVEAPVSGNYTFKTNNDDATRVWVNGQSLINDWNGHAPTWQQGSIYLTGGQRYDIKIDFADFGGQAQAQLYWEYPGQGLQFVPSCRLYPIQDVSINSRQKILYGKCITWYLDPNDEVVDAIPDESASCGGNGANIPTPSIGGGNTGGGSGSGQTQLEKFRYYSLLNLFYENSARYKGIYFEQYEKDLFKIDFDIYRSVALYIDSYNQKPDIALIVLNKLGVSDFDGIEQAPFSYPPTFPILTGLNLFQQVSREYVVLKISHSDWSQTKCLAVAYKNVYLGKVHFILDAFGLVPGAGEVADGINGGIYLLEGDNTNAALSFAAMLPIGGWAVTGGKWARNALKYDGFYNGVARYVSQHGLNFTLYGKAENRLDHILKHMQDIEPGSNKNLHGVFYGTFGKAVSVIDEGWEIIKRNNIPYTVDQSTGNWLFEVNMGRDIGWEGGTIGSKQSLQKLQIITKPNNEAILVTAYPMR